jgi:hypothetical protein
MITDWVTQTTRNSFFFDFIAPPRNFLRNQALVTTDRLKKWLFFFFLFQTLFTGIPRSIRNADCNSN